MPLFGPSAFTSAREKKLSQRQAALDKASEALSGVPVHPQEELICSTSARDLSRKITSKEWSSLTVVAAFARRLLAAQAELNCLTEVMIADALKQAKSHDEHQERTGATLGPLHGIPFTLKDMFNVKGYDSSLGVSKCVDKPYQSSSTLYETLTKLGAILLAKTNVPQTLLSFECNNPIFGPTQNPYVKGFTCGGSSGGEAAVLAKNGSALGFGTDIGGSLRIPTGWCGVYALKPTRGRFTSRGLNSFNVGFEGIPAVAGPMCRNMEDLIFSMKLIIDENLSTVDTTVTPIPWNETVFSSYTTEKMKFGYYIDDGVSIASPPVKRAILETAEALQKQGHEVIQVTPPNVLQAVRIFLALTSAEGYANLRDPIKPDPMEPAVRFLLTLAAIPSWLRSFLAFLVQNILHDSITASSMCLLHNKSAADVTFWVSQRDDYRQEFNEWFRSQGCTALIAPTSAIPATKINGTKMVGPLAVSTFLYNVLDWPVGVVPVTKVRKGEVMEESRWKGKEKEGYSWMLMDQVYGKGNVYKEIVEGGEGLPVGVQVVGSWNAGEEGVLAIMDRVDAALKAAKRG